MLLMILLNSPEFGTNSRTFSSFVYSGVRSALAAVFGEELAGLIYFFALCQEKCSRNAKTAPKGGIKDT